MNKILITILVIICILQILSRYYQVNYYNRTLKNLYSKYKSGYLGTGIDKTRFKARNIVVLLIDKEDKILEMKVLSGMSAFSRFKDLNNLIGMRFDCIFNTKEYKKYKKSIDIAYEQIQMQRRKNEI
ncbi:MAG: transcriptional regulator GutM [Tissierellia bacterium]|nr:transcriptional regulator GutM [Tissierellia bacterium]